MSILEEFMGFLKEYSVIGLAIAFVVGASAKELVNAIVDDLMMPVLELLFLGGDWQEYTYDLLGAKLKLGHLAATFIEFLIIAAVVFLIAKYIMEKEKIGKL